MTKKWHLIGMIKRIVYRNAGTGPVSLNRTFYLSVEGTHVREISKIFWISAHLIVPLTWRSKVLPFDNKN
jgi:hypothetical protein